MGEAERYRMWVLNHWRGGAWSIAVDRVQTKRGKTAIARLIKDGLLAKHPESNLYQLTPAGHDRVQAGWRFVA